jgi:hypothetical protein
MKNRLIGASVFAILAAWAVSPALADAPAWTYVEGGYLNVDPDNFSGSGDNWFAGGSLDFLKHFHVSGRYINGDYADNADLKAWTFAAGWHGALGEKADIVGELTWSDSDIDNVSDSGKGLTAGVRWRMIKLFELDGFAHWTDYQDAGSQDSYEARGMFYIWRLAFGAAWETSSEANQYNAFVRFNFGRK